jgi:multiple sugar transport system permease protein
MADVSGQRVIAGEGPRAVVAAPHVPLLSRVGGAIGHLFENELVFGYTMVAPAVLYIVLLVGYPFFVALRFTVTSASTAQPIAPFTGLKNLQLILQDEIFRRALFNTFVFTISSQVIQTVLGTILAFLLLRPFRGRRIIRALFVIPFTIPVAIGAITWNWMLNPTYSVVNWVGSHTGLLAPPGPNWLGEEQLAMLSVIIVNVWRGLPFTTIILMAGISAVPQEIVEAAALDAAGFLTRWRKIMVPIIAPILYIAMLFNLVFQFTDMTIVWLLTKGNPVNTTHVLASYAFVVGVISGDLGQGATISLFLFPVMLVAAIAMLRLLKSRQLD